MVKRILFSKYNSCPKIASKNKLDLNEALQIVQLVTLENRNSSNSCVCSWLLSSLWLWVSLGNGNVNCLAAPAGVSKLVKWLVFSVLIVFGFGFATMCGNSEVDWLGLPLVAKMSLIIFDSTLIKIKIHFILNYF